MQETINLPAIAPPADAPRAELSMLDPDTQTSIFEMRARLVVAQHCPCDEDKAIANIRRACQTRYMAENWEYNIPNRGRGPNIKLAKELARNWGNFESGYKVIAQTDDYTKVEVFALDLQ